MEDKEGKKKYIRKFPKTHLKKQENLVLLAGILFFIAGIFILVANTERATRIFAVRPVVCLLIGAIVLFVSLSFTVKGTGVFIGLFLLLTGIVFLLIDTHIIPYGLVKIWPTIMISSGISLFPAGFYKLKRVRTVYLFPAIMLVLLGIVFLLFSLHVFPMSFRWFISHWWPLLIVIGGAVLVGIFIVQQANAENFPYMEDDSLVEVGDDKQ